MQNGNQERHCITRCQMCYDFSLSFAFYEVRAVDHEPVECADF